MTHYLIAKLQNFDDIVKMEFRHALQSSSPSYYTMVAGFINFGGWK